MSLTMARNERVRSVLTHASLTEILFVNFSGARVSNILNVFYKIGLKPQLVYKFSIT